MSGLPKGWAEASLQDIGSWFGGGTPSKAVGAYWKNGTIPWVSPKDMKVDVIDDAEDWISEAAVAESTTRIVPKGSVLVVTRSGILRHSLPVALTGKAVAINQDLKAIVPAGEVSPHYVLHHLRGQARQILRSCAKAGTTVDSIDTDRLRASTIPLAPAAEQRRIVAKIGCLSARSKRARLELQGVPSLIEKYRNAILSAAFSGKLTANLRVSGQVPNEWRAIRLAELGMWSSGGTPKSTDSTLYDGGIPWIRSGDLPDGPITSHQKCISEKGLHQSAAKWVASDAVLIAMYGATIGKLGLTTYPVTTNQAVASLVPAPHVSPKWAFYLLRFLRPDFVAAGQGGAQPNISQQFIRSFKASMPELDEQHEIVRLIERAFVAVDRIAVEVSSSRALLDCLDQAILEKAFRGELVPQDPDDEPASILLKRIRTERAAASTPNRGRKLRREASG